MAAAEEDIDIVGVEKKEAAEEEASGIAPGMGDVAAAAGGGRLFLLVSTSI